MSAIVCVCECVCYARAICVCGTVRACALHVDALMKRGTRVVVSAYCDKF